MPEESTDQKLDAIKAGIHLILNKLDRIEGQLLATATAVKEIESTEATQVQGSFGASEPPK